MIASVEIFQIQQSVRRQKNDLAEAKRLNDRIESTARVFCADPFVDMHNRMKEALVLLGKLPRRRASAAG